MHCSPMLWISQYGEDVYYDGSIVSVCLTSVDTFWPAFYFVGSISIFFILPLIILLILYTVIARHLMNNPGITSHGNRSNVLKYRKQVMFMLGAVVLSFFICLLPFRALTLWIIIVPSETILELGIDGYYSLVYFCRIMLYINSALNPILYNLMSSKFREGFLRLLGCKSVVRHALTSSTRKGTFHTTSTNLSSSQNGDKRKSGRIKEDADTITGSIIIKNTHDDGSFSSEIERSEIGPSKCECGSGSSNSNSISIGIGIDSIQSKRINGFSKQKRSTFDDIEELEEQHSPQSRRDIRKSFNTSNGDTLSAINGFREKKILRDKNDTNGKSKFLHSVSFDDKCIECDNNIVNNDRYINDESEIETFLRRATGNESFV